MYVEPETFQQQIVYLKKHFTIVSLEDMVSREGFDDDPVAGNPHCILTFDDGWKDFYEFAYPILRAHGACATVFLPTDFIGTANRFWTDRLAFLLGKMDPGGRRERKRVHSTNRVVDTIGRMKGTAEHRLELAIRMMKRLDEDEIETVLDELGEEWNVRDAFRPPSFLSWQEAREMHGSGIIRFGSHAKSHRMLTSIPDDSVREELALSKDKLLEEKVVHSSFLPFAYPNGEYDDRIAKLVEETGYHLAVTTERGWNKVEDRNAGLYRLKRVGIHQDMTSTEAMLACRIHGAY
jgi:peptidoglycan/xylan/chitin deacetylase (PgdA/CDA1 family)